MVAGGAMLGYCTANEVLASVSGKGTPANTLWDELKPTTTKAADNTYW
jgi:hypothetical protein